MTESLRAWGHRPGQIAEGVALERRLIHSGTLKVFMSHSRASSRRLTRRGNAFPASPLAEPGSQGDTGRATSRERAKVSPRSVRRIIAILAIVGLGASASCGSSSEERAVEDTVAAFLNALGRDGEGVCLRLSREAQAKLMRREDSSSCERAAESTDRPDPADLLLYDFGEIRFFGRGNKSAHVPFILDSEEMEDLLGRPPEFELREAFPPIPLEEGDGQWRITRLDWHFEQ